MIKETITDFKSHAEKSIEHLHGELAKIQTGRASTSLVNGINVSYYGAIMPLMQLATISVPEPQQLLIDPFDKNALMDIEKAINSSDLGVNGQNDGEKIRIVIPPLTEERRKQLASIVNQKIEEARISIRNSREDAWKKIKSAESDGSISEDEKYNAEEELNKTIAEFNDKVKETGANKEKEIMTV